MHEPLKLLWGTVLFRPYVFAFLAAYIVAGWQHIGWKRTLAYIPIGYSLAWASEFASIHCGFPYGDYFYIQSTADRELWVFGVPFMDSLSYVFLSYCSYSLAAFIMSPVTFRSGNLIMLETPRIRRSWQTLALGAFLFMLLDIVIDPVALLGEQWFLGKIYGYHQEGLYFGIPMSNFGGWLLVGFVLVATLQALDAIPALDSKPSLSGRTASLLAKQQDAHSAPAEKVGPSASSWLRTLGPLLYFSVLSFNIAVTLYIGHMLLGLVDLLLFAALLVPMVFFTIYKNSNFSGESVYGHLSQADFLKSGVNAQS